MKKIPCVFKRTFEGQTQTLLPDVTDGCQWVIEGEGSATIKRDGTACMLRGGQLFKRYDAKRGKIPPAGFEPCQEPDPVTGHWPGWVPVDVNENGNPADKHHRAAFNDPERPTYTDGTFELCGPAFSKNPEGFHKHVFIRHGSEVVDAPDRTQEGLRLLLMGIDHEGVVFHHPDGRMAKLTRHNFGFDWPLKT